MIRRRQKLQRMPVTAAEWFAARQGDRGGPEFERALETWLAADPEHHRLYALCEIAWDLSRPAAESLRTAPILPERPARSILRRRWMLGITVAASMLIAVIALWFIAVDLEPQAERYTTAIGEQRTITLADGSRITLNTRTALEATITRDRREIVLEYGEAFFDVAYDSSRPFHVLTSLGNVRVVGTRFAVYRRAQSLEVSTEQGLVQVAPEGLPESLAAAFVRPGESAVIEATDAQPRLRRADLARIDNWRHQRLEFDAAPLVELLEEFNRYTPITLHAANEEVGAVRVSGVFHIGDVAALSKALQTTFRLDVRSSGRSRLIVEQARVGETDQK